MPKLLALFSCLLAANSFGQVILLDSRFDFGTLTRTDQNYADFRIKNTGNQDVIIFRVEVPSHVDVNFSSKSIPPDSTAFIRLAYNPKAKGNFKEEFEVFVSAWSEPQSISLVGESTFSANEFIPCPDFSKDPAGLLRPFAIAARTLQNIPVDEAEIHVYKDGRLQGEYFTDPNGEAELQLPLGRYFFSISGLDTSIFVNASNDHLVAFLDVEQRTVLEKVEEITPNMYVNSRTEFIERDQPSESQAEENLVLPLSEFKPNNLVFLVDVSTSMKHNGKLDLLKVAMVNLVDVLRDVDRFTLISYASEAGIILKTERNLDKQMCIKAINELTAGGKTEGTKALNRAGLAAQDFFIEDGNNQIILATDGAFNEGAAKAQKLSAKFKRKGIVTSVVGIKCGKYTTREMQELAVMGGGNFVPLNDVNDAEQGLLDEVKIRSKKELR
ncbi:MAG: VWA domain-containing protein [Bacteroidota bacterium]